MLPTSVLQPLSSIPQLLKPVDWSISMWCGLRDFTKWQQQHTEQSWMALYKYYSISISTLSKSQERGNWWQLVTSSCLALWFWGKRSFHWIRVKGRGSWDCTFMLPLLWNYSELLLHFIYAEELFKKYLLFQSSFNFMQSISFKSALQLIHVQWSWIKKKSVHNLILRQDQNLRIKWLKKSSTSNTIQLLHL